MSYSAADFAAPPVQDNPSAATAPTVAASPDQKSTSGYTAADFGDNPNNSNNSNNTASQPHDLTVKEYAALSPEQQKAFDEHTRAGRSVFDPATGFLKGVGDTVNTLSGLISRVAPSLVRPQDVARVKQLETASNPMQEVGKVGENIAEFFTGDEALKGLSIAERLGLANKVAKLAETNPVVAQIIHHGLVAMRQGTASSVQQLAHGTTPADAAKTGIEMAGLGTGIGAATEGMSALADTPVGSAVKDYVSDIRQGAKASQEPGEAAVRQGVQSATDTTNANTAAGKAPKPLKPVESVNRHSENLTYQNDNSGATNMQHQIVTADENGNKIGDLVAQDTAPKEVTVRSNQIYDKNLRGQGRGVDQLDHLLSSVSHDTEVVKSDISTSEDARGAWEKLVKENPDAVTKQVYKGGQTQYSVDMNKWRAGNQDYEVPQSSAKEPLTKNAKDTIIDSHLGTLEQQKAASYKKVDDALGFDLKELKDQLATNEDNLKQLGDSDPDKKDRLIEAINDQTDRVTQAEAKLKESGINPKEADALNTRWEAGKTFRQSLLKRTKPDGDVDIKGLWNDAKAMRKPDSRYGDRLEQFFGSQKAADDYVNRLAKAVAAGQKAAKRQQIAQWVGKLALGGTGYEAAKHLIP